MPVLYDHAAVSEWARREEEKSLAAHVQRKIFTTHSHVHSFAKYSRAVDARRLLEYWMAKDMAADLPPEPPVVLERQALNQLDKRAKTRKLAGPKEAKDENEHRQHREKKEQQELRNAQTKARNQKRAKARADKLAA